MSLDDPLQDDCINDLIKYRVLISIYLKNGIRLKGYLTGQDKVCIFLKQGPIQMVYKHRINTIIPEISFMKR